MAFEAAQCRQGRVFGTLRGCRRFFSGDDDDTLRRLKSDASSLSWSQIAELMPGFSARQLRERWCNYLSPTLKTSSWTEDEDRQLLKLYAELGPRWGLIGGRMGNRSAPDTKNRFQTVRNRVQRGMQAGAAPVMLPPLAPRPANKGVKPFDGLADFSIKGILV
jgi:hypothetical protein